MSELLQAAQAVIDEWNSGMPHDGVSEEAEDALRAAVDRVEKQDAVGFREWWDEHVGYGEPHRLANDRKVWTAAQQAERERIRARAKLAAEKTWKAGDWYVGPQHNNIEAFVKELLREGDDT